MELPASVLITGVTGCVGSALARRLISLGVETSGIVRSSQVDAGPVGLQRFVCEHFSREELDGVLIQAKPRFVIHLAAAGVSKGPSDIETLLHANVDFTVNLVRAAAVTQSAMLHTGSCFEYGSTDELTLSERAYLQPFSLYGATKAASVHLSLGLARQLSLPLVVLRLFGIYGPGEAPLRLIPQLIRSLNSNQAIDLTAGTQQRDLLFVEDVVDAYLAAMRQWEHLDNLGTYNVCCGQPTTVRQVGECLATEMQRSQELLRWGTLAARAGEPARIVGDGERFRRATGWQPGHDLRSGLQKTVEAFNSFHTVGAAQSSDAAVARAA